MYQQMSRRKTKAPMRCKERLALEKIVDTFIVSVYNTQYDVLLWDLLRSVCIDAAGG